MYTGKTLQEIAAELDSQRQSKKDYVADTRMMQMSDDGRHLNIEDTGSFELTPHTHRQIGTRLKVPAAYYDRLRDKHPDLLADNINYLFQQEPEKRMVRTLHGNARAFLSNRYHRIDHDAVFAMAYETLSRTGLELRFSSCEVTDRRLYLKVNFPRITGEAKVGDIVESGVLISNSEIGLGSYAVAPFLNRLACINGMVINELGNKRAHVGRATGGNGNEVYELYQDDTLKADDEALLLKMRDIILACANPDGFNKIVAQLRKATEDRITGNPVKAVETLSNKMGFSEAENGGVLNHLINGGDLSRWGLANAVTAAAQDGGIVENYDHATDLETAGGRIITLSRHDWQEVAEAA